MSDAGVHVWAHGAERSLCLETFLRDLVHVDMTSSWHHQTAAADVSECRSRNREERFALLLLQRDAQQPITGRLGRVSVSA